MRGQSGVEFLISVSLIFILSAVVIMFFNPPEKDISNEICSFVASSIDYAYSNSTMIRFDVPQDFLIVVYPGGISVGVENPVFCPLSSRNVSKIMFMGGKVSAFNLNERVYVLAVSTDKNLYRIGETVYISSGEFVEGGWIFVNFSNGTTVPGFPVFYASSSVNISWKPEEKTTYIIKAFDNLTYSEAERMVVVL